MLVARSINRVSKLGRINTRRQQLRFQSSSASKAAEASDVHQLSLENTSVTAVEVGNNSTDPSTWIDHIPTLLDTIHTTSGIPWWATLAVTAVSVRTLLLPTSWYGIRASQRMGQSVPEMLQVISDFRKAQFGIGRSGNANKRIETGLLLRKGLRLIWKKHETHPIKAISAPIIQIPFLLTFAYGVREMTRSSTMNSYGLEDGGALWFTNLVVPDSTLVLPLAVSALTYINLDLSLKSNAKWMESARFYAQMIPMVFFPIATQLPQGVLVYWVSSASFSLLQTVAMRNPKFQKMVGLGPTAMNALQQPKHASPLPQFFLKDSKVK